MRKNINISNDKEEKPIIKLLGQEYKKVRHNIIAFVFVTTITFVLGEIFIIQLAFWYSSDFRAVSILLVFICFLLPVILLIGISQFIFYKYYTRSRITINGVYRSYPNMNNKSLVSQAFNIPNKPLKYFRSIEDIEKVEFYYHLKWPKYFIIKFKDGETERFDLDTSIISPTGQTDSLTIKEFFNSLNIPIKYITLDRIDYGSD